MNSPHPILTLAICLTTSTTQLQSGTVTNTADSGNGSLRNTLATTINGETIAFDSSLNGRTITLTSGELTISGKQVTIDASQLPNRIEISGNNQSRIFNIENQSNVSLKHLELLNGRSLNENGGGIRAYESQLHCTDITIRNCISDVDGGALWVNSVTGSADRCSFMGNDSTGNGGGIFVIGNTPFAITNSVIAGNRAPLGGGIATFSASPSIINCTIQGNSGYGIYAQFNSTPTLRNTIVWGNRSGDGPFASQQIQTLTASTADVDYSLIEGMPNNLNNLNGTLPNAHPNFILPLAPANSNTPPSIHADLRVFTHSPILNSGSNQANSTLLERAGKTRIQDTTIDLGAFEGGYVTFESLHPSLNPTSDTNENGVTNFVEYAAGMNPSTPNHSIPHPTLSRTGNSNFLTNDQRTNAADVTFSWETSTSLANQPWQKMLWGIDYTVESTSSPSPNMQRVVFRLLGNDPKRFYRQAIAID
jgi:parallel beta-helix repeat protein